MIEDLFAHEMKSFDMVLIDSIYLFISNQNEGWCFTYAILWYIVYVILLDELNFFNFNLKYS